MSLITKTKRGWIAETMIVEILTILMVLQRNGSAFVSKSTNQLCFCDLGWLPIGKRKNILASTSTLNSFHQQTKCSSSSSSCRQHHKSKGQFLLRMGIDEPLSSSSSSSGRKSNHRTPLFLFIVLTCLPLILLYHSFL